MSSIFNSACCLSIVVATDAIIVSFRSNKSLSRVLVHEHRASQKRSVSSHHPTACGDYKRNVFENISSIYRHVKKIAEVDHFVTLFSISNRLKLQTKGVMRYFGCDSICSRNVINSSK